MYTYYFGNVTDSQFALYVGHVEGEDDIPTVGLLILRGVVPPLLISRVPLVVVFVHFDHNMQHVQ